MKLKNSRNLLIALTMMFSVLCNAQSSKKAFRNLSKAEKRWVLFHPFKAKKAYRVSKVVTRLMDSIQKTETLGKHQIGNQLDAFKHTYWMWTLASNIGCRSAKSLGKAHEKGNYQTYKKQELEDGTLPDAVSSEMDMHNNAIGIQLFKQHGRISKKERIKKVLEALSLGKLRMIAQRLRGVYVDVKGAVLPKESYEGLWENRKILIPTKAL